MMQDCSLVASNISLWKSCLSLIVLDCQVIELIVKLFRIMYVFDTGRGGACDELCKVEILFKVRFF